MKEVWEGKDRKDGKEKLIVTEAEMIMEKKIIKMKVVYRQNIRLGCDIAYRVSVGDPGSYRQKMCIRDS